MVCHTTAGVLKDTKEEAVDRIVWLLQRQAAPPVTRNEWCLCVTCFTHQWARIAQGGVGWRVRVMTPAVSTDPPTPNTQIWQIRACTVREFRSNIIVSWQVQAAQRINELWSQVLAGESTTQRKDCQCQGNQANEI